MSNFIYTTLTMGGPSAPVNLDNVLEVSKIGTTFTGNPSLPQNRFGIQFLMANHGQNVSSIIWNYDSATVRNADYVLLLAENTVELGNAPVPEP